MHEPQNVTMHVGLTVVKPVTALEELATQIRGFHDDAMSSARTAIASARACGERLAQAKALIEIYNDFTPETTGADVSRSTSAPTTHPPKARQVLHKV